MAFSAAPLAGGGAVTLASGLSANHLGAASASVYWSSGTGVWTLPGAGQTPTQVSKDQASDFAADGGRLFAVVFDVEDGTEVVDESL